jgi:hypothetical protein
MPHLNEVPCSDDPRMVHFHQIWCTLLYAWRTLTYAWFTVDLEGLPLPPAGIGMLGRCSFTALGSTTLSRIVRFVHFGACTNRPTNTLKLQLHHASFGNTPRQLCRKYPGVIMLILLSHSPIHFITSSELAHTPLPCCLVAVGCT